jgi:hypothetical protein
LERGIVVGSSDKYHVTCDNVKTGEDNSFTLIKIPLHYAGTLENVVRKIITGKM